MLAMPAKIKNVILAPADTIQAVNAPMARREKNVLEFLKRCCVSKRLKKNKYITG